ARGGGAGRRRGADGREADLGVARVRLGGWRIVPRRCSLVAPRALSERRSHRGGHAHRRKKTERPPFRATSHGVGGGHEDDTANIGPVTGGASRPQPGPAGSCTPPAAPSLPGSAPANGARPAAHTTPPPSHPLAPPGRRPAGPSRRDSP